MQGAKHALTHLILRTALHEKSLPHFIDEEIEVHRG